MKKTTTSAVAGDNIEFKIAAKAASTQLSGEYQNIINFIATGNVPQTKTMQDVTTWGSTLAVGDEVEAVDSRDGNTYTVAKLADGNIWMTQNLDLFIDSTKTYTSADTDISSSWNPSTSTYATGVTTWNGSIPESYDSGNLCWNGTLDPNYSSVRLGFRCRWLFVRPELRQSQ